MSDGTSLSLTPGFQTAFRIRAVPRATLDLAPDESFVLSDVETHVFLEGTCEFLPNETPCRVTWIVEKAGGERTEFGGFSCQLQVSGETAKVELVIDLVALDLVGLGKIGVEIAPDFPYCEPVRIEPGPWQFDNKAHVSISKSKGLKIGSIVTLTPTTSGAFDCGALKLELSESDEGERGGGEAQVHMIVWEDGDREPRKWRIGCTHHEGPPAFDYREFGEAGTLEFGATLFHGNTHGADDQSVEPAWQRVWRESKLVEGVPFPKLESFEVNDGYLMSTVSGKISGFESGLEVPLWVGAAIRKGTDKAAWHSIPVSLEDDGSFSASFGLQVRWNHIDDLYGMSCGAITASEAFAGVIDYDTALVTPAAGTQDEVPPRSSDKATAKFVILGQPAEGALTSSTGRKDLNDEVIEKANSKSGGTYKWSGTDGHGCPSTIRHGGKCVLKANSDGSTYCCGFTLWVALEVAQAHALLDDKSAKELINMRSQWFGGVKDETIRKKQLASALKNFGLGKEIPFEDAKKGDFAQLWRTDDSGHSVIFLNWVKDGSGKRIGIKYRSSNTGKGISDREEKFTGHGGTVDPKRCYAGRLMAKVSRPPQIVKGALRFFVKVGEKKTYVEHSDIDTQSKAGTKVFCEVGGKADDFPFATVLKYGSSRAGISTRNNGKDRPRLTPAEVQGSRMQVAAAVSNNEGSFVDVQAYDDSYLTHGTAQWTQKSGNLQKLLALYKEKKPSLFAKYFEDRDVEIRNGEIYIDDEKLPTTETSLHLAYCLWQSGYDPALQEIQIEFLAGRIDRFYPSHSKCKDLSKYYTSEQSIAHLLDLNVNRPAYTTSVAQKGIDAFLKANPSKKDPSKWTEADEKALVEKMLEIRHTYGDSPMTHSKKRAKAIKAITQLSTKRNSFKK